MQNFKSYSYAPLIIAFVAGIFFCVGTGSVHLFDWDEINFAESAREMILSDDYLTVQINFKPFWEKPPLFFWLQAGSMHLFGVNEFAARLPNAVFGFISLLSIFHIGKKYGGAQFGLMWMLVYIGSFLPHIYFKTAIIDPVFNYFIFISLVCFVEAFNDSKKAVPFALLAGFFAGLSFLTKGPAGLLLIGLTIVIYLIITKGKSIPSLKAVLAAFAGFLIPALCWVLAELHFHGWAFLYKFILYQIELFSSPVATHGQPFYYHFVVVLIGCFPMSLIALAAFNKKFNTQNRFSLWMKILFWVVMILFSISKTKIVHYSSMTWLPLSYLSVCVVMQEKLFRYTLQRILYFLIGGVISLALILSGLFFHKPTLWISFVKDPAFIAAFQSVQLPSAWLPVTGLVFLAGSGFAYVKAVQLKPFNSIIIWAVTNTLVISALFVFLLPAVESLSQRPLISIIQKIKNEDALIYTHGFKSYAHFYYGERTKANASNEYLPQGAVTADESKRTIYFISKEPNREPDSSSVFTFMGQEGGFRLYRRDPVQADTILP